MINLRRDVWEELLRPECKHVCVSSRDLLDLMLNVLIYYGFSGNKQVTVKKLISFSLSLYFDSIINFIDQICLHIQNQTLQETLLY